VCASLDLLLWGQHLSLRGKGLPRARLEEDLGGSSEFLPALHAAQGLCLFQSSSFSSITDSTMSLNIITVTLNMGESGETTLLRAYYMPDTGQT